MKKIFKFLILNFLILNLFATEVRCRNLLQNFTFFLDNTEVLDVKGVDSELMRKYKKYNSKIESEKFSNPIKITIKVTSKGIKDTYHVCVDREHESSFLQTVEKKDDGVEYVKRKYLDSEISLIIENEDNSMESISDNGELEKWSDISSKRKRMAEDNLENKGSKIFRKSAVDSVDLTKTETDDNARTSDDKMDEVDSVDLTKTETDDFLKPFHNAKDMGLKGEANGTISSLLGKNECSKLKSGIYTLNAEKDLKIKIISSIFSTKMNTYKIRGFLIYEGFFSAPIYQCSEDSENIYFSVIRRAVSKRMKSGIFDTSNPIEYSVPKFIFNKASYTKEDSYPNLNYENSYYNIGCSILNNRFFNGQLYSKLNKNVSFEIESSKTKIRDRLSKLAVFDLKGNIEISGNKYVFLQCKRRYDDNNDSVIIYYNPDINRVLYYYFNILDFIPSF